MLPPDIVTADWFVTRPLPFVVTWQTCVASPQLPGELFTVAKVTFPVESIDASPCTVTGAALRFEPSGTTVGIWPNVPNAGTLRAVMIAGEELLFRNEKEPSVSRLKVLNPVVSRLVFPM